MSRTRTNVFFNKTIFFSFSKFNFFLIKLRKNLGIKIVSVRSFSIYVDKIKLKKYVSCNLIEFT